VYGLGPNVGGHWRYFCTHRVNRVNHKRRNEINIAGMKRGQRTEALCFNPEKLSQGYGSWGEGALDPPKKSLTTT